MTLSRALEASDTTAASRTVTGDDQDKVACDGELVPSTIPHIGFDDLMTQEEEDAIMAASTGELVALAPSTDTLNPEQKAALELAMSGKNVFLTGRPGTGKSHTARVMIAELEKRFPGSVMVVAPTGVAALNLGGQTMHAKPGPGVPHGTMETFGKVMRSKANTKVWKNVKVLVLDEVSMADAEFLDWYLEYARRPNKNMQVIMFGDFSQLPPVGDKRSPSLDNNPYLDECVETADSAVGTTDLPVPYRIRECNGKYAFQSACWRGLGLQTVQLKHVHRTRDVVLLNGLDDMRAGNGNTLAIKELVAATKRELQPIDGVRPTVLYATRQSVSLENEDRLQELRNGTRHTYPAKDDIDLVPGAPDFSREQLEKDAFFLKECQAPKELELRVGCQVMMLRNESAEECASPAERLVNGSRGVVIGFQMHDGTPDESDEHTRTTTGWPVVKFMNGREERVGPQTFEKKIYRRGSCIRTQVPLMLAWAITVHKSQGMSIDFLKVDLQGTFADGQAYVAISRATCLTGLEIANFSPRAVKTSPLVRELNVALDEGRLNKFLETVPTWWEPVMNHKHAGWAELFTRNPSVKAWEDAIPQKRTHGLKRKLQEL